MIMTKKGFDLLCSPKKKKMTERNKLGNLFIIGKILNLL